MRTLFSIRIGLCAASVLSISTGAQAGFVLSETQVADDATLLNNAGFGSALAEIGDVDADGTPDLAVGAPFALTTSGDVWIVFLRPDGTARSFRRLGQNHGGFTATGVDNLGLALCGLGDLDQDGTPDLAVAADRRAWILFLQTDGRIRTMVELTLPSLLLASPELANLGDLDGDGVVDLLVADESWPSGGRVAVVFLNPDGSVRATQGIDAPALAAGGSLAPTSSFGSALASLGDLEGDGKIEIAIGDPGADGGRGCVWLYTLEVDGRTLGVRPLAAGTRGFHGPLDGGDHFGAALVCGDLDGDGQRELCVGAPGVDDGGTNKGGAWILFFGPSGRVEREQALSQVRGGFGATLGAGFARSLAFIGDLDRDGGLELALGAPEPTFGLVDGSFWTLFLAGPAGASEWPVDPLAPGRGVGRSGPRLLVVAPGARFSRIDSAVASARDGDVILVEAGRYLGFTVENKALTLVCEPGVTVERAVVRGLAATRSVAVRGINGPMVLEDNQGPVWMEDCSLGFSSGGSSTPPTISRCALVGLFRCLIDGSDRRSCVWGVNADGGTALRVSESTLLAFDSRFVGLEGCASRIDDSSCFFVGCVTELARAGADALTLLTSNVFLAGGELQGGAGGAGSTYTGSCSSCPVQLSVGPVGAGLALDAASSAFVQDASISSTVGSGVVVPMTGQVAAFEVSTPLAPGDLLVFTLVGTPGHEVTLHFSGRMEPHYRADLGGYEVVPPGSPSFLLGLVPPSGVLQLALPTALLSGREQAEVVYMQPTVRDPVSGVSTLGAPSLLVECRR